MTSRITVDAGLCMASGYCFRDLPRLFRQEADGSAAVRDESATIPTELEDAARKVAFNCPSTAIEVQED